MAGKIRRKDSSHLPDGMDNIHVKVRLTLTRGQWSEQILIGDRHDTFIGAMKVDDAPARVQRMWGEVYEDVIARFHALVAPGAEETT